MKESKEPAKPGLKSIAITPQQADFYRELEEAAERAKADARRQIAAAAGPLAAAAQTMILGKGEMGSNIRVVGLAGTKAEPTLTYEEVLEIPAGPVLSG